MRGAKKSPKDVDCTNCERGKGSMHVTQRDYGRQWLSVFCEMKGFFKGEKCA
jgi:hypothetical protein